MGCLYQIESPSGKKYIGITTKTLPQRMREHEKCARLGLGWGKRKGRPPSMVVHRAMRKYGYDKFVAKELVRANDWSYLCDLERKAIVAFETATPLGYNAAEGGEGATMLFLSQEAKEKHRIKARDGILKSWRTPEARAAHMAAFRGEKFRSAISRSMKTKWQDPELRPLLVEQFKKASAKLREIRKAARRHVICGICAKPFDVKPSHTTRRYCSAACGAKARTGKPRRANK